jgi:hypothetical protein
VVAGFLHQYVVGFDTDRTLLYISIIFAVVHLVVFAMRIGRPEPEFDDKQAEPVVVK